MLQKILLFFFRFFLVFVLIIQKLNATLHYRKRNKTNYHEKVPNRSKSIIK